MLWMHLIIVMGTRRENITLWSDRGDGRLFWQETKLVIPELSVCSPEKNDLPFALRILNTKQTQHQQNLQI